MQNAECKMQNEKERLIELIVDAENEVVSAYPHSTDMYRIGVIADHLLENSVIVPPYKAGTKVYVISSYFIDDERPYIIEDIISHYFYSGNMKSMILKNNSPVYYKDWDKVYPSREDAEKALRNKLPRNVSDKIMKHFTEVE